MDNKSFGSETFFYPPQSSDGESEKVVKYAMFSQVVVIGLILGVGGILYMFKKQY